MPAPKHDAFLTGFLLTGAPATWVLLSLTTQAVTGPAGLSLTEGILRGGAVVALLLAGLLVMKRPVTGRLFAAAGLLTAGVAASPFLLQHPGTTLAAGVSLLALAARFLPRPPADLPFDEVRPVQRESATLQKQHDRIQGSLIVSAALILVLGLAGHPSGPAGWWLATLTVGTSYGLATEVPPLGKPKTWRLLPPAVVLLAAAALGPSQPKLALLVLLGWPLARLIQLRLAARTAGMARGPLWELVTAHPARLMVVSFLSAATVGGILLWLPTAHTTGHPVSALDATFTAFSATCVTGLVVQDTATAFSGFGQLVILALIQLGGLGIMTFATIALRMAGRRVGLAQESAMAALLGKDSRAELYEAARSILRVTLVVELSGAVLLAGGFLAAGDGLGAAAWRGTFTAVSAYCNAGFALQTTSLMPYQQHGFILITTSLLIITGGLGPLLVVGIPDWVRRRPTNLVVKVGLVTTAILLCLSFSLIASVEWSRTLAHLPLADRLTNAWFQAATLRTAGFNSMDIPALHPATLTLMLAMMFIGGCPGSTAGGIKTTTAAMMVLTVVASLQGRMTPRVFGRRIGHATLVRASAIVTLASLLIVTGVLLLALTQPIAWQGALFEVVSATGTVGLSMGATPVLDEVGRVVIIVCMFAGRVGPLTLFLLVGGGSQTRRWRSPTEELPVG